VRTARKNVFEREGLTIEKSVISNYVRLCLVEGIKPGNAYKDLEKKLDALSELKAPKIRT
jgi:hypothetical protein